MMKFKIAAVVAVAVVLSTLTMSASHAKAWVGPPAGAFKVLEMNIGSGSECASHPNALTGAQPGASNYVQPEDCLGRLKQSVTQYDPTAVFGEEFCETDYQEFKSFLLSIDPSWDVYYEPLTFHKRNLSVDPKPADPTNGLGCPNPNVQGDYESKGIVLAAKGLYAEDVVPLAFAADGVTPRIDGDPSNPWDGTAQQYVAVCAAYANTSAATPTRLCTTHLETAGNALNAVEILNLQTYQEKWARPAIGGDFNLGLNDTTFTRYLHDSLPNKSTNGANQMMDPLAFNYVDHITFRLKGTMNSNATSISAGTGWNGEPTSTHDLRKAWVVY